MDIKLSANEEPLCHKEMSDICQGSFMYTAHGEQIWMLVQARSHLLAEILHLKMLLTMEHGKGENQNGSSDSGLLSF